MTKNSRKEKEGDNMKFIDKKKFLIKNYPDDYENVRREVFNVLSNEQTVFCVCGKIASGLHEDRCSKFNALVDKETVKTLQHLIKVK